MNDKTKSAALLAAVVFSMTCFSTSCVSNSAPIVAMPAPIEVAVGLETQIRNTRPATVIESSERGLIPSSQIRSHFAHKSRINALTVSANGNTAVSGAQDGTVVRSELLYPSSLRQVRTEVLLESAAPILALSLSPSERFLAVSQFSSVVVLDLDNRKIVARMSRVKGRIVKIAWDPREELIAMGLATGELYVWNVFEGKTSGGDSRNALEQYENFGVSSIVGLLFHPSAGALFVAERVGEINLWRLVRTDEELGLRDATALVDKDREGRVRVFVGRAASSLEDVELSRNGEMLFAVDSRGFVYRWKTRGLKALKALQVDEAGLLNIEAFDLTAADGSRRYKLFATSGRDQGISFWCENAEETTTAEKDSFGDPVGVLRDGMLVTPEAQIEQKVQPQGFVSKTPQLYNTPTAIEISARAPRLWAAEKTGSLFTFNIEDVLQSQMLKSCR